MAESTLRTLNHRSEQLRIKLRSGTNTEVNAAREMMRLSLVDLYGLGYWQAHPDALRDYMRLYRAAKEMSANAPLSKSAPDRMARYSP